MCFLTRKRLAGSPQSLAAERGNSDGSRRRIPQIPSPALILELMLQTIPLFARIERALVLSLLPRTEAENKENLQQTRKRI